MPRRPAAARSWTWAATASRRPASSSARTSPITEVFAWGATLGHADKTTGEDNADRDPAVRGRPDGDDRGVVDGQGRHRGPQRGLLRARADRPRPRLDADPGLPPGAGRLPRARRPTPTPAGSIPSPTSRASPATTSMFRHFVEAYRDGIDAARDVRGRLRRQHDHRCRLPLDAQRPLGAGRGRAPAGWRRRPAHDRIGRRRARPRMAVRGDGPARAPGRDPGRRHRAGQPVVRRDDRRGRPRPPVRDRPFAHPGRGDVPALRLVSRASTRWSSCP